jgi:hypothetical protein
MYKIDLFQYKSQFHYVFNVNPGNQGSRYLFVALGVSSCCAVFKPFVSMSEVCCKYNLVIFE